MDLIPTYKKAFQELEPHLLIVWVVFFIANFTTFFLLIPLAGFLMMLLRFKREGKKPEFADLFSQIDFLVPLLILFILLISCALAYGIASAILLYVSPALFYLFRITVFLVFVPLLIVVQTYTILLVCDQRLDSVTAMKKAFQLISKLPKEHYFLGLGALILMLPCLLGGPIAYFALVDAYQKHFAPGAANAASP